MAIEVNGQTVEISDELLAGSGEGCALVLDDPYVSATHFSLARRAGRRLFVRDEGSRNGTFVDGVRVAESEVRPGSRIQAGGMVALVVGRRDPGPPVLADLVGEDPTFRACISQARRTAASNASVLITGESGTGKELFARLVHEASPRGAGPFVALNCGAIPRELVESELFGHERGAFTGASERRRGVFEQAAGGTLFLDEIGELPREQQPRLLRVLETRRLRRVGGEVEHAVDVRVVAATHRDLRGATTLRLDLFHRLAAVELRLPPLRERRGDIPLLVERFLGDLAAEHGARRLAPSALAALMAHSWPGNVRELRHALLRAVLLCDGELKVDALLPQPVAAAALAEPAPRLVARESPTPAHVDDVVREMMARALAEHGSLRRAAAALGMSKSTFHERAQRLGLLRRQSAEVG